MELPKPEAGQVIRYGYLWFREAEDGGDGARKDRPCAIVVAITPANDDEGGTAIIVVPITHSQPVDPSSAIEIPKAVKRRLGLDGERSWIVVTEVNRFIWPGPDLVPARGDATPDSFIYGSLPRNLLQQVQDTIKTRIRAHRLSIVKRTE